MAEPKMEAIGRVSGFFAHPSVAVIDLTSPLALGDTIYVKGHTTDFQQAVESMQVDRALVQQAQAGQSVGGVVFTGASILAHNDTGDSARPCRRDVRRPPVCASPGRARGPLADGPAR